MCQTNPPNISSKGIFLSTFFSEQKPHTSYFMAIYENMKTFSIWDGYGVPKYGTSMSKFSLHISNLPVYDLLELVLSWGGSYDISKSFMGRQLMRLFVTHALWRSRGKERTEKWKVIWRFKERHSHWSSHQGRFQSPSIRWSERSSNF